MNKKKLEAIRKKIDLVDKQLLNIIGKRTTLVKKIITVKNHKKQIVDKSRIKKVLIKNEKFYGIVRNSLKKNNTKVFSGNTSINKIISGKLDYTMSAIVGLAGLQPTIDIMKVSKVVAIANKETIICGWQILSKLIKKYKTEIVPVDSEHFSIMELTKGVRNEEVEEIIITASGGPFLNIPINKLKKVKAKHAIKHPNWKMGKKISVDSANMMNKVFEVIEACKLFKFDKSKYKIMIHPQSYVHSIIRFKNGLTKMVLYNTDMKIPISNTLYKSKNNFFKTSNLEIKRLNNLNFQKANPKIFPSINLLNRCFTSGISTPIIVNAANEVLVDLFLKGKIEFLDIVKMINRVLKGQDFKKYAKRNPNSVKSIKTIDNWARLKTINMCVI